MHIMQPLARLIGRINHGLTPWRRRGDGEPSMGWHRYHSIWSESWAASETWVERMESAARNTGTVVFRGGEFDEWDLHLRGGLFGAARVVVAVEEHGVGKQLVRTRTLPYVPRLAVGVLAVLGMLCLFAVADGARIAAIALAALLAALGAFVLRDCAAAAGAWARAAHAAGGRPSSPP